MVDFKHDFKNIVLFHLNELPDLYIYMDEKFEMPSAHPNYSVENFYL